jgi:hypothetical protein
MPQYYLLVKKIVLLHGFLKKSYIVTIIRFSLNFEQYIELYKLII